MDHRSEPELPIPPCVTEAGWLCAPRQQGAVARRSSHGYRTTLIDIATCSGRPALMRSLSLASCCQAAFVRRVRGIPASLRAAAGTPASRQAL